MLEIIVSLAASLIVFALLAIVFLVKGRSEDNRSGRPTCARCSCQQGYDRIPPPVRIENKCGADQS